MLTKIAYRFDKELFFPKLDRTLKIWNRLTKQQHNGVGPGGMMDDVYTWILELIQYHRETGEILKCHYVPNLTSHSKLAIEYEKEFLQLAITLLGKLPSTMQSLFHVTAVGRYLVVMFEYDTQPTEQSMCSDLQELCVFQFSRPKKIPKSQLNMTSLEKS